MPKDQILQNTIPASEEEIRRQIAMLELEELLEKKRAKNEAKESELAVRRAAAEAYHKGVRAVENAQAMCSHRKMNGRTRIAGQRASTGEEQFICLGCGKNYDGGNLPADLRPHPSEIGGPERGVSY